MNNLELYNSWRDVPKNAQRPITGGNLNGKTDINPMWRIKALTETFGPVGIGWYTKITEHWSDEQTIGGNTERVAWVRVELYIKYSGEWSAPIEGIGGSKYAGKGRGSELNDEAFKMAETDAISVACKKLGIGADIYWSGDNTKYTQAPPVLTRQDAPQLRPLTTAKPDAEIFDKAVNAVKDGVSRDRVNLACRKYGVFIDDTIWTKIMDAAI